MTTPLAVTRLAHSCHLIEIDGRRVLTDPWFTTKSTYYPGERFAMSVADLPHLDAVLVTHEHYDHCDLAALSGYADLDVPLICPGTVAAEAKRHGFRRVIVLEAWEGTSVGGLDVTATPGEHVVHEVTFVIQRNGRSVYFGGDTLAVPTLAEIPTRLGPIDLALLPTNGLCVRPLDDRQVVMDALQAAELVSAMRPKVAIPHHYAFTSGFLGDRTITKTDSDPRRFAEAARRLAPASEVLLVATGVQVAL
jgi:L-ascorbate metabolism protein UlaG (beta-lactamase superfamily)